MLCKKCQHLHSYAVVTRTVYDPIKLNCSKLNSKSGNLVSHQIKNSKFSWWTLWSGNNGLRSVRSGLISSHIVFFNLPCCLFPWKSKGELIITQKLYFLPLTNNMSSCIFAWQKEEAVLQREYKLVSLRCVMRKICFQSLTGENILSFKPIIIGEKFL